MCWRQENMELTVEKTFQQIFAETEKDFQSSPHNLTGPTAVSVPAASVGSTRPLGA